MKKKIVTISLTLVVGGLLYFTGINNSKAHDTGAPAGYTGSPSDGKTCDVTSCHNSNPLQSPQPWISSNVPVAGYSPDTVYTITAKAVKIGYSSFGFEISPQNASGTELGTLINTSTTTQIISTKYITHTVYGYRGTDSVVWTFQWRAPARGTGSVTFYGAFNCGNGNANATGTYVYPATLVVAENMLAGINTMESESTSFSIFPNPAKEQVTITYNLKKTTNVEINMYGLDGRKICNLLNNVVGEGNYTQGLSLPSEITPGIYFIQLITNGQSTVQKIVVEK